MVDPDAKVSITSFISHPSQVEQVRQEAEVIDWAVKRGVLPQEGLISSEDLCRLQGNAGVSSSHGSTARYRSGYEGIQWNN